MIAKGDLRPGMDCLLHQLWKHFLQVCLFGFVLLLRVSFFFSSLILLFFPEAQIWIYLDVNIFHKLNDVSLWGQEGEHVQD